MQLLHRLPFSLALRAAALLALGGLTGVAGNALRSDGLRPGTFAAATTCAASAGPAVAALPPTQAVTLCGDPGVLIADVRPAERYAAGHVAGAVHLPCAGTGSSVSGALAGLADKHTVVAYGDSTEEARAVAEALRARLDGQGRPAVRVVIIDGGFAAWDGAGLACSSGPCAECGKRAEARP